MLKIIKNEQRGMAKYGWVCSRHSFSFADYYDPDHMGFGPLRVLNDDQILPGGGLGRHGHRDMEMISYVMNGALKHSDSLGNESVLTYGDVQCMSAGAGIMHSEKNVADDKPAHVLQIWIEPDRKGMMPDYQAHHFDVADKKGRLCLIAAPERLDNALLIHQQVRIYACILGAGPPVAYAPARGRGAYVHVATGEAALNGLRMTAGDAMQISGETRVEMAAGELAEVLLFDVPMA